MSHDRGFRAAVRRVRRGFRRHLSLGLARWRGAAEPIRAPLPLPRRILVCRINARLGNILFLTPLLRSLAAAWPDAEIDVLLREPVHADLLAGMPGVRRVHALPRNPMRLPGLVRRLRRRHYDLAIDPNVHSTGNRIALALCGARHRLGFAGPDQWLRLTHAAARPTEPHQARQPLSLFDAIEGLRPRMHRELAVYPDAEARRRGEALLRDALESTPASQESGAILVGFFTGATGHKRLPAEWWRRWLDALTEKASPVQVLAPGESPLAPGIAAFGTPDLDVLAAAMGRMTLFVAADSGPMHLAAAAGTPVVALFTATDPGQYAPLGRGCLTLRAPLDPAAVAAETRRHLARLGSGQAESA